VTLTGRVLPIGGLKEKTLAARRSGVTTLLFPQGNKKDWDELAGVVTIVCSVKNAVQLCDMS
jgi:ATP-dependent Lon protease